MRRTDATEKTTRSTQFKSKAVHSKAVQGTKPRTHMPVITEETAQEGGYSALVTSVDMMLLLIEREVCADDTGAVNSICRMAAITGELETGYKGCYIAVKGEPNRELVQWRTRVRESIRGADTKEKVEDEMERLCACAGTTAEWLRQRVEQEQTQAKKMEEFARGREDKDNLTPEDEPEATVRCRCS